MAQIIDMPKLSDTMTVGTLVKWLKNEGDTVATGDMLAEVETDKATMELESFFDGTLLKQFAAAGEQVAIGEALCAIGEPGEKVEAPKKKSSPPAAEETADTTEKEAKEADAKDEAGPPPPKSSTEVKAESTARPATPKPEHQPAPTPPASPKAAAPAVARPAAAEKADAPQAATPAETEGERLKISPLARKLALELGVDPRGLKGSGPGGRIVRADIEAAAKEPRKAGGGAAGKTAPAAAPATAPFIGTSEVPVQEEKVTKNSNMRATIARRLVEAKTQLPHFYVEIEIDAAPMLALRAQINAALGDAGKLSVNDLILKASAHALRRVPQVNCSWEGDSIRAHAAAHVSFAVALEDGLITPVIFNAHAKTVFQIGAEARALGAKAKARKLQPNEYTGGTFCVSNLGMFGVHRFSAIINPPQAAILAVGTTVRKPVVNDAGQIVAGDRLSLTLSCDHRVVDGATGAQFLAALKDILEKPVTVLF